MRLNQFIALHTGHSRRQADELIKKGLIEYNGEIGELFQQVAPSDKIRIYEKGQWRNLTTQENLKTVLFYKPIFCITSKKDEFGRKTIYTFLPKIYQNLKPAGRLDYMSEGLLVMSNDGNLLQEISHPSKGTEKVYLVGLKYVLKSKEIKMMGDGMQLEDYKLNPVQIELLQDPEEKKNTKFMSWDYLNLQPTFFWYKFVLTEGRNNQIRQMCEAFGQKVLRLIRIQHSEYILTPELHKKRVLEI